MNYIKLFFTFSLCICPINNDAFDSSISRFVSPFITKAVLYATYIKNFFALASHNDLTQTKKEILELFEENSQALQKLLQASIDALFQKTKNELQKSIEAETRNCSQTLATLQKALRHAQKKSMHQIQKNHEKRTVALKSLFANFMEEIQKYNKTFVEKIITTHHNDCMYLHEKCNSVESMLKKIQSQHNRENSTTQKNISLLSSHLNRIKNKFFCEKHKTEQLLSRLVALNNYYQIRCENNEEDFSLNVSAIASYLILPFLSSKKAHGV